MNAQGKAKYMQIGQRMPLMIDEYILVKHMLRLYRHSPAGNESCTGEPSG